MINIPVSIGDIILTGRFKNKKTKVTSITTDEYGMPLINGKKACTFRIHNKKKEESSMKKLELVKLIKEEIKKINEEDDGSYSAKNDLAQLIRDFAKVYKSPKTISLAKRLSANCETTNDVLRRAPKFFDAYAITDSDVITAVIDRAIKEVESKGIHESVILDKDEKDLFDKVKNIPDNTLLSWAGFSSKREFEDSTDEIYSKKALIQTNYEDILSNLKELGK